MEEFIYEKYSKLGEFFTGTQKRKLFYLFALIGFCIVLSLQFFLKFKIETDTMFWVFSSIVQSLLALTAFMGVVVIFKYQSISTRGDRLIEEMNRNSSDLAHLGGKLNAISIDELLENLKEHVPEDKRGDGFRTVKLRKVKEELDTIIFVRNYLSRHMIKVTIYSFLVVLLSSLILMVTTYIALIPILALTILYIFLFFIADILRLVIKIIASVIL